MRARLRRSLLGVTMVGILVLGLPLGLVAASAVRDEALRSLDRGAETIAFAVDDDLENRRPVDPASIRLASEPGWETVVTDNLGRRVHFGPELSGRVLEAAIPAEHGNGRVVVRSPASVADSRVTRVWLVVGLLSLTGIAAAVAVAEVQSRRLVRPLDSLSAASARLGDGDFSLRAPRSGVAEIDTVAGALDRSAAQIADLMHREREFSANASHQLRTPLTALRLHLEEGLAATDPESAHDEARAALAQADRLEATITALLAVARGRQQVTGGIDVATAVEEWASGRRQLLQATGRRLVLAVAARPQAAGAVAVLDQVLDVLADNALHHGAGTVTVEVTAAGGHPAIRVGDEGPGVPTGMERAIFERHVSPSGRTGVGLALARTLAESVGGRLELIQARPAVFEFFLPA